MDYVIIILIVVGSFGVGLIMLSARFGLIGKKTEVVLGLDKVKEIHKEEIKAITDIKNVEIANLQKEKSVLQTKNQRTQEKLNKIEDATQKQIQTDEGSVERLQQEFEINPIKAVELVRSLGMNPDALSNPALAPLLWEKLNDNKDFAIIMGVLVPKGSQISSIETSIIKKTVDTVEKVEETDPIDKLFSELEKAGNVA